MPITASKTTKSLHSAMAKDSDSSSVVRLNIGGKKFYTTIDTLTHREPESMLAAMVSGRHTVCQESKKGYIFVDRDGKHFRHILNWLRDGIVPTLTDSKFLELLREAEYYQLLDVDVEGSIFHSATLRECEFAGANLRGALLAGANLRGANLRGANLQDACLIDCNFCGADLRSAHLQTADLTNANLKGANLEGANLKGVKLHNANLKGANLQRAYLGLVNL